MNQVRSHPANATSPNRALVRACWWQIRKRLARGSLSHRAYDLDLRFPARSGSFSNLVYFGECFEWVNINLLRRYLRPGDSVVDVGGNVGMFTYAAVQAGAQVHVFEPLAWAADVIRDNVDRNGLSQRVHVHSIAVTDRVGSVPFTQDLDVSSHIQVRDGGLTGRRIADVPTSTLDAVLPPGPIALAKIDVEGAEALALLGLSEHLAAANPPVLIVEADAGTMDRFGSSRARVFAILSEFGYEPHLYDVAASRFVPFPPDSTSDMVAIHTEALTAVEARLRQ